MHWSVIHLLLKVCVYNTLRCNYMHMFCLINTTVLEKNVKGIYNKILPVAVKLTMRQGFKIVFSSVKQYLTMDVTCIHTWYPDLLCIFCLIILMIEVCLFIPQQYLFICDNSIQKPAKISLLCYLSYWYFKKKAG